MLILQRLLSYIFFLVQSEKVTGFAVKYLVFWLWCNCWFWVPNNNLSFIPSLRTGAVVSL